MDGIKTSLKLDQAKVLICLLCCGYVSRKLDVHFAMVMDLLNNFICLYCNRLPSPPPPPSHQPASGINSKSPASNQYMVYMQTSCIGYLFLWRCMHDTAAVWTPIYKVLNESFYIIIVSFKNYHRACWLHMCHGSLLVAWRYITTSIVRWGFLSGIEFPSRLWNWLIFLVRHLKICLIS